MSSPSAAMWVWAKLVPLQHKAEAEKAARKAAKKEKARKAAKKAACRKPKK
ncbi:hypothetical protein [Streptomyces sp. HNA39]|uniref:hypothetical protein n=1 Tax=Streptomyces sp. HNA39 TaxID=2850561 RepID=UPI00200E3684|nr:hypothetical protein [Streptomyces sp. HNA39]UQA34744.1 hypothetical protein KRR37_14080 [Streptomyces sp. HNA39]